MEVPETARKRQTPPRAQGSALGCCVALAALLFPACNLDNPGTPPPAGVLSYPLALSLGKVENGKADVLYVVNSNFDLRYNAGSVQAYDLEAINREIDAKECKAQGVPVPDGGFDLADSGPTSSLDAGAPDAGGVTDAGSVDAGGVTDAGSVDAGGVTDAGAPEAEPDYLDEGISVPSDYDKASEYGTLRGVLCDDRDPGGTQCCFDDNRDFLVSGGEVLIDSYAAGIATSPNFDRLYVAQRGRDSLLYIDTDSAGALNCGSDEGRCTRGPKASASDLDPEADFAPQPKALTVGKLSDFAQMSVEGDPTFIATVHETGDVGLSIDEGKGGPVLHSSVAGFASFATSVTLNAAEHLLYVSSVRQATLDRYGVMQADDRWVLYPSVSVQTTVDVAGAGGAALAGAFDIRDVRVDDDNPNRMFVLMRGVGVNAVLIMERDPELSENARVTSATRVGDGPSKLARATLGDRHLLFVSCFDARAIFVIDEADGQLVSVIRGLSGPFDMAIDTARNRIYVADFRANVLRVLDVEGLVDSRLPPPRIIATIGKVRFGGKLE